MKNINKCLQWIGTSWKMNMTLEEAKHFAQNLRSFVEASQPSNQVFIIPPFTALSTVCQELEGSTILVGAQNAHWEDSGPFTGEISCRMIADCGAKIVELGHSERRAYFGETDLTVNLKVQAALKSNLRPLICVGDSSEEYRSGAAADTVCRQVAMALYGLTIDEVKNCIIAYEPIWAIGEGATPASPDHANRIMTAIRNRLSELFDLETGQQATLLYGGSIDAHNSNSLLKETEIDGLFIGRAAWECSGFLKILTLANEQQTEPLSI